MPIGVPLTMPTAPSSASATERHSSAFARPPTRAASAAALSASTSKMRISSTASSASAKAIALPTPPAPSTATGPRRAFSIRGRAARRKPLASVLWPTRRPSRKTTVLTAPIASALADSASRSADHRLFVWEGDVDAGEAECACAVEQPRKFSCVGAGDVDELIMAAHADRVAGRLVHRRRSGGPDRRTNQA